MQRKREKLEKEGKGGQLLEGEGEGSKGGKVRRTVTKGTK